MYIKGEGKEYGNKQNKEQGLGLFTSGLKVFKCISIFCATWLKLGMHFSFTLSSAFWAGTCSNCCVPFTARAYYERNEEKDGAAGDREGTN